MLVDADPQANSTTGLGFDLRNIQQSLYDCMVNDGQARCDPGIGYTQPEGPPSHIDLVGAELELINHPNREQVMKQVIDAVKDDYDFGNSRLLPFPGLITVNALVASDSVIIPVQCEFLPGRSG